MPTTKGALQYTHRWSFNIDQAKENHMNALTITFKSVYYTPRRIFPEVFFVCKMISFTYGFLYQLIEMNFNPFVGLSFWILMTMKFCGK